MNAMVGRRTLLLAVGLIACCSAPPEGLSEQDEARVYGRVLSASRSALGLSGALVVHPFRAVAQDGGGGPTARLDAFEYEPAEPLRLLAEDDDAVALCEPNAAGACEGTSYLVLSEVLRTGPRDAAVVVLYVDRRATGRPRSIVVRLRSGVEGWYVAGTEPAA
ncbi:MAG: hypothetical protein ACOC8B_03530 [Gemmatimonadota bacterium]